MVKKLYLCRFTMLVNNYMNRTTVSADNIRIVEAESDGQAFEKLSRNVEERNDPYGRSCHLQEAEIHEVIS